MEMEKFSLCKNRFSSRQQPSVWCDSEEIHLISCRDRPKGKRKRMAIKSWELARK